MAGRSAAAHLFESNSRCPLFPFFPTPFFPTALWPLPFGRESFGLGRREPLPHGRSCQRPPVPDPPEDETKAEEHGKPCRRILGWQTMNGQHHEQSNAHRG